MVEACCEVVVTADDPGWLTDLTRALVETRMVACGQVVDGVRAVYRWDGDVHDETEARVALHTRASLVPALVERIRADHPATVPCVIALPIVDANPEYLAWIVEETGPPEA